MRVGVVTQIDGFAFRLLVDANQLSASEEVARLATAKSPVRRFVDAQEVEHAEGVVQSIVGDLRAFCSTLADSRPFVRRGAAAAFADRFRVDRIWPLVCRLDESKLAVIKDGEVLESSAYRSHLTFDRDHSRPVHPAALAHLVESGASLIARALHWYDRDAADIVRAIILALGVPARINCYISPPSSKALSVHHDVMPALVVQVEGSKRFEIFEPVWPFPLTDEAWGRPEPLEHPIMSVDLEPFDVLYLPPGFPHQASAGGNGNSVHLTIALSTRRVVECISDMVWLWRTSPAARGTVFPSQAEGSEDFVDRLIRQMPDWRTLGDMYLSFQAIESVRQLAASLAEPPAAGLAFNGMASALTGSRFRRSRSPAAVLVGADETTVVMPDRELYVPPELTDPVMEMLDYTREYEFATASVAGSGRLASRIMDLCRFFASHGALEVVDGS